MPYVLMCDDQSLSSKHSITCFGDISLITQKYIKIHQQCVTCPNACCACREAAFADEPVHGHIYAHAHIAHTHKRARALVFASFTVCLNVVVSG